MNLEERFIKYISFDTMSSETSKTYPSTPSQIIFAKSMLEDLKEIGIEDAYLDEYGIVYAHININRPKTIGLIAHMDTSPELIGGIVYPKKVSNYDGGEIILDEEHSLSPKVFSVLNELIGDDLLVTDGKHLLGGDDKAGIAIIFEFAKYYISHPEEFNFNLAISFTPDEEVGAGWAHFDVNKMKADIAFTLDGGTIYEANHENFNAASAVLKVTGVGVHPGSAKGLMENAALIGSEFNSLLPCDEIPAKTDNYEGFYHLCSISGNVEECSLEYILRDHNRNFLEQKKAKLLEIKNIIADKHPTAKIELSIKDDYRNMSDYFIEHPEAIEMINKAYLNSGVKLEHTPIRGGTDGAMITYMGLPCPNLGVGDFNPHGRYEFVSLTQMYKMLDVIKALFKE